MHYLQLSKQIQICEEKHLLVHIDFLTQTHTRTFTHIHILTPKLVVVQGWPAHLKTLRKVFMEQMCFESCLEWICMDSMFYSYPGVHRL